MKRSDAWLGAVAVAAVTVAAMLAPWPIVAVIAAAGMAWMPRGRLGLLAFGLFAAWVNGSIIAWTQPGGPGFALGPVEFGLHGFIDGAIGSLRLSAILAVNLGALQRSSLVVWLDALGMPPRVTAYAAAMTITSEELAKDLGRGVQAQRLLGTPMDTRSQRVRAAIRVLPGLAVTAIRRAGARRDALRLAGIDTPPRFVPIIAVAALALAGRLAFIALPNLALTYVIVFLGGTLFGSRVGAWGAVWAMMVSDVMLSGITPTAFVNVPAMALVGALGGLWQRPDSDAVTARAAAAIVGILVTFAFSAAADLVEWALVPEFRGDVALLQIRIATGLAFNAVPALVNGALFALAISPVQRAVAAYSSRGDAEPASR